MGSVPRVIDPDAGTPLDLADVAPELGEAFAGFMAASLHKPRVDIVTRELVRIYSGRLAHCRICRNLRVQVAVDRGLDEDMVAKLDDFEHSDLSERHKAALRFAHAFLVDPQGFDESARTELLVHFRPDQVAEMVLDLVRLRPGSKLTVATGREPVTEDLIFV